MRDQPKRIQRSRAKGWRMPEGAVYVGRPTKNGNRWRAEVVRGIGWCCTDTRTGLIIQARDRADAHDLAVSCHRRSIILECAAEIRAELRGRDLVCWCPLDQPCHADVLLEIANA